MGLPRGPSPLFDPERPPWPSRPLPPAQAAALEAQRRRVERVEGLKRWIESGAPEDHPDGPFERGPRLSWRHRRLALETCSGFAHPGYEVLDELRAEGGLGDPFSLSPVVDSLSDEYMAEQRAVEDADGAAARMLEWRRRRLGGRGVTEEEVRAGEELAERDLARRRAGAGLAARVLRRWRAAGGGL